MNILNISHHSFYPGENCQMNSATVQKKSLKKIPIIDNQEIAPGAFVLSFKRDFLFIPGQVLAVTTHENIAPRLYSIASGAQDEEIKLLYTLKPDGELTPELANLKTGDSLFVSGPTGKFFGIAGPSVWIAAGTGIAPFVSMWRSGLTKDKILIHGSRFLHSFYFEYEFKNALGDSFIRCCTKESGDGVFYGRVTQWLEQQPTLWPDKKYYICGSAEMVVEARDILIDKGISFDKILAEIYF